MKLNGLSHVLLLTPAACAAIKLPFKLPAQVESFFADIQSRIEFPKFLKDITDPAGASPLLSLHRSLIEISSITGNERTVADWLAEYLTSQNFTVETQAVSGFEGDRVNIFAYLGKNRTTRTLVTSHIDTVPPFIPYKISGNTIHGRGSNDAKGSVAVQIAAVEELMKEGALQEGDISLLFVVGEEHDGIGMKTANNLGLKWDTVIFGEPTENKLAVGHKGILMFDVIAHGKASHSGYPHLGINANSHLIQALAKLDALKLPSSKLLGESTLNIGKMEGGVAYNVIPAEARANIAVRVAGDLEKTISMLKGAVEDLPVELSFLDQRYGPVELDHDIEGFETIVCSYGTDVPNLHGDHKRYLYGPGSILTAHGDNEFVLKSDLYEALAGYKTLIKESLWPSKSVPAVVVDQSTSPAEPMSAANEKPAEPVEVETHPHMKSTDSEEL